MPITRIRRAPPRPRFIDKNKQNCSWSTTKSFMKSFRVGQPTTSFTLSFVRHFADTVMDRLTTWFSVKKICLKVDLKITASLIFQKWLPLRLVAFSSLPTIQKKEDLHAYLDLPRINIFSLVLWSYWDIFRVLIPNEAKFFIRRNVKRLQITY